LIVAPGGALIHCVNGRTDPQTPRRETVREPDGDWEPWSLSGLTLNQAEQWLDWLESQNCSQLEATVDANGVTVHCLRPPWLRIPAG
jgi:hypothetical protein